MKLSDQVPIILFRQLNIINDYPTQYSFNKILFRYSIFRDVSVLYYMSQMSKSLLTPRIAEKE